MQRIDATAKRVKVGGLAAAALGIACLVLLVSARPGSAGIAVTPVGLLPSPLPTPSLPTLLPTPSLPPLPAVSPPALPTSLPTPSLPVSLGTPSPSVPAVQGSPTPSATPSGGGVSGGGGGANSRPAGGGGSSGGGGQGPGGGLTIPFTGIIVSSPLDAALLGAFAVLPLLLAIWMLLFGRAYTAAWRSRDAQVRLAVANELGIRPRELVSVSTKSLFKLREEAAFDELTGVLRRAAGISALDREIARARRQRSPLTIAFIDLDGLKEANDRRGHKAGDELLRGLVTMLKDALRAQDLVLRYGGDEFICVLPDTVADAGRAKLSWVQTEAETKGIGFSIGVAELDRSDDVVSLLGRADTEMYAVKARRGKVRDLRLGVVGGASNPKKVSA